MSVCSEWQSAVKSMCGDKLIRKFEAFRKSFIEFVLPRFPLRGQREIECRDKHETPCKLKNEANQNRIQDLATWAWVFH